MVVSAYAEPMVETYARPRFGAPREPKNLVNPGNRLVRVIDFVTADHVRAVAFLLLCGLLLFLPGFFNIPPIDRDEARFAQATKQMVETGDYVDIRFQEAVLLTYWTALAFVTRRGAVLAALIMCSSVLLSVEARRAKTDAMLLLTVVAAMGALARVYLSWQRGEDPARPPWSYPIIFWTALAGGILLKGPLILMFIALTVI